MNASLPTLVPVMLVTSMAAVYAHARLARFTNSAADARLVRALLLSGGAAFAAVTGLLFASAPFVQAVIAATSFGVVHVPAACILALKGLRARESRS